MKSYRNIQFAIGLSIEILQGDITLMKTDAIVNAANKYLKHGGGVAGAIAHRGGPTIQSESNNWITDHGCIDSRNPAYTTGGKMPCKYVIHAVGPVWGEGDEDTKLNEAISSALELSEKLQVTSISFPAISTGIFGFPIDRAARIFIQTLHKFMEPFTVKYLKHILLVLNNNDSLQAFISAFDQHQWSESA